jgi:hypothetical protein
MNGTVLTRRFFNAKPARKVIKARPVKAAKDVLL